MGNQGKQDVAQHRQDRLTPEEPRRALYVDFEGGKGQAPVLLGCANRSGKGATGFVWQAVTDPRFEPLTRADEEIELLPLADAVERILQRAEAKDRRIVAWSNHELDVVAEYCPQHPARFSARYVNARTLAVYWRNACHGGEGPASNDLAAFLAFIGYEVSEDAGPGRAGETIRRVAKALDKGQGLAGLTDDQRRRWQDLRAHNLHDCRGMTAVSVLAADEVAARSAPAGGGSK